MSKEPGVFSEYISPPLAGAAGGAALGGALGAAGGYGAGSLKETALRHYFGSTDPASVETIIKKLPPKTRAIILGALAVGVPAAAGGFTGGLSRSTDPYAARTAGGVAGGIGGLSLGYLLRVPGSPISSLLRALAMGAAGVGAGGAAGLAVGTTRRGKAEQRLRKLLEEARYGRTKLTEEGE